VGTVLSMALNLVREGGRSGRAELDEGKLGKRSSGGLEKGGTTLDNRESSTLAWPHRRSEEPNLKKTREPNRARDRGKDSRLDGGDGENLRSHLVDKKK